jgi:hypothetical protein
VLSFKRAADCDRIAVSIFSGYKQSLCAYLPSALVEEFMAAPTLIKERMEVLGSDGVHVGIVEHIEGNDEVKLSPDDPDAGGEPHFIPLGWVIHVEMKVHLKHPGAEARAKWKTH